MVKKLGRKPNTKLILKAQELIKKGLSYSEVSRLLLNRIDKKTIYRWVRYKI